MNCLVISLSSRKTTTISQPRNYTENKKQTKTCISFISTFGVSHSSTCFYHCSISFPHLPESNLSPQQKLTWILCVFFYPFSRWKGDDLPGLESSMAQCHRGFRVERYTGVPRNNGGSEKSSKSLLSKREIFT